MFIGFQVLFFLVIGIVLVTAGGRMFLRGMHRPTGAVILVLGFLVLAWWPFVFWDEARHTHTDADGTWIEHR